MMTRYRLLGILSFLAIVLLCFDTASAQKRKPKSAKATVADEKLDTVLLRYDFTPGEKVTYRVIAYDSIVIYDTTWRSLARERAELVTFRCDSVVPNGYIMSMTTSEYVATERLDTLPPITRNTHDWVDRTTRFLMSPTGRRIDLIGATDRPGNAPGGPFAPLLLPNLGEQEKGWVGQSGAYKNEQWLVDNIYPPIKWTSTDFRIIPDRKDTLGAKTVQIGISEVGSIAYQVPGNKDNPVTRATINGGGDYFFSPKLGLMVGGSFDLIANFTLELPNGRKVNGRHVMSMYYHRMKGNGK